MPESNDLILGGQVDHTGDYSDVSIELANENRHIWTAGALQYWQTYAEQRQTVVYAVTIKHARNLASLFNFADISAKVLSSETAKTERDKLIGQFQEGTLNALINVDVATEGFDLPDASCVVMARPTLSEALYLQMVGRGLRPKSDGGDCLVLDLAGNVCKAWPPR